MSTVSAVVLWRAFILSHIALHCYLFFPGFVRGKQNSRQRHVELTHPREQFREWILKQESYVTHHHPEAVGFSIEVTVLLPAWNSLAVTWCGWHINSMNAQAKPVVSLAVYSVKLRTDSSLALWTLIAGYVGTDLPYTSTVKGFSLHSHHISYQVRHPPT